MYDTFSDTNEFIDNSLTEIRLREKVPVNYVFSVCFGFIADGCLCKDTSQNFG